MSFAAPRFDFDAPPAPAGPRRTTKRVYLPPGRLFASAEDVQVTTILGSCVAVCVWDARNGVGGMNHFLLPDGAASTPRFGQAAIPLLIADLVGLGGARSEMRAKVFGGATVLEAFRGERRSLGARNVEVARERLEAERIPIVAEDVAGEVGRKVLFDVRTGSAWVKFIESRD